MSKLSAPDHPDPRSVAVFGAGMVGVSCAWALRMRGWQVNLFDAQAPGSATSGGNAGLLAGSSFIPFNNPTLWSQLPALLGNQTPKLRYVPSYVAGRAGRLGQFVWHAREPDFQATALALNELISHSRALHTQWMAQAGCESLRRDHGWLMLYRSAAAQAAAHWSVQHYRQHGIAHQWLSAPELIALEPAIRPGVFHSALWVQDASSISDPGALVRAYAQAFVAAGGHMGQRRLLGLRPVSRGWQADTDQGVVHAGQVVLALGPWSDQCLRPLGLNLPLIHERGQHQQLAYADTHRLTRPVNDSAAAYVLSPMAQGYRLTTGVELNRHAAPVSAKAQDQLAQALSAARQAIDIGPPCDDTPWLGARPTLPDSRPMIGPAPRHPGLWLALGHQHIGLSTGPATGDLLARWMAGEPPLVNPQPFRPDRFRL
jgi:D-amino-acid dehydrogenase